MSPVVDKSWKTSFARRSSACRAWGGGVWERLAGFLDSIPPKQLRSWRMRSALVVQAFIDHKVLRIVRKHPCCLAEGDVEANLEALRAVEEALDPTSQKIRDLVRAGYPLHRVAAGVRLMAGAHWTSTSVEQGHGSAAVLHKLHSQYGANTLCQRSMLHMFRNLASLGLAEGSMADRAARKESSLLRRRPQHLTGRQMFLKDLMSSVKRSHGGELTRPMTCGSIPRCTLRCLRRARQRTKNEPCSSKASRCRT